MGRSRQSDDAPRVAVVGAGASGLACGLACARAGGRVTVLEAAARPGRSILASGNGRCNLTNAHLSARDFNDPSFVASVWGEEPLALIRGLFDRLGVLFLPDEEGRCYPASRHAASVLDPLLSACAERGVAVECGARVESLAPPRLDLGDGHWQACVRRRPLPRADRDKGARGGRVSGGGRLERIPFDRVVWAAGGGSATGVLAPLGVEVTTCEPVLCPIATDTAPVAGLNGVRAQARLRLLRDGTTVPGSDSRGEVLFRPYGVSGIAVFDLSRIARPKDVLCLDLLPDFDAGAVERIVDGRLARMGADSSVARAARGDGEGDGRGGGGGDEGDPVLSLLDGVAHPALASKVMREARARAGRDPHALAAGAAALLKDYRLEVVGVADTEHAQVTRGGVANHQVDPADLQMRDPALAGLFCCGEALDVDGRCGGFNLSWAWVSGTVAGRGAALTAGAPDAAGDTGGSR